MMVLGFAHYENLFWVLSATRLPWLSTGWRRSSFSRRSDSRSKALERNCYGVEVGGGRSAEECIAGISAYLVGAQI